MKERKRAGNKEKCPGKGKRKTMRKKERFKEVKRKKYSKIRISVCAFECVCVCVCVWRERECVFVGGSENNVNRILPRPNSPHQNICSFPSKTTACSVEFNLIPLFCYAGIQLDAH